ncbi:MAG: hypothetical protein GWM90_27680, partial [Gemmatimonadetes bacterium]|nr:efflux RND transporter permease subunit [Gemmatimonadota bacterium]NIU78953.1 hypothetical protein [Gammaproteobacteria bacterium]NIV88069.1 hypothetical protein [Actinomycetota bacterium]NIQ58783.1 efflux RND transporter permease subunit [Gemmatimonadota bacterium]NIX47710.1 hypothetical protein [Gemmatimonadota bacterium]
ALERWYAARLERALDHRRAIFGLTAAGVIGAVLLWPLVPVELTPPMETNEIDVDLRFDRGLNITAAAPYLEELTAMVEP